MRRFFIFLYGMTAVAQLPMVGAVAYIVGGPWGWGLGAGVALAVVLLLPGRVALARWDRPISGARRVLLEEPYYVHWCASLAALLGLLVALPLARGLGRPLLEAALFVYLLALPVAVWGVVVRRRWVRVHRIDVVLPKLPAAFDGYRVAQLSDLHVGSFCPRARVDRWVDRVNRLDVDLVALTGDYVTSGVHFHHDISAALTRLTARDGVFAVMGNHDYFGEGEPLMSQLRAGGIRLLRNEHEEVMRADAVLHVAGVDDVFTRRIDIDAALRGIPAGAAVVMLAHDPRSFPDIAARGASLVLSGHTHWGQVGLPWLAATLNYARIMTNFAGGTHRREGAILYVSPGLGTTGPPIRVGAAPEITLLTLRSAASADAAA